MDGYTTLESLLKIFCECFTRADEQVERSSERALHEILLVSDALQEALELLRYGYELTH